MKILIQIIILGILSLSFLGQTQASDRGRIQASSKAGTDSELRSEKLSKEEREKIGSQIEGLLDEAKEGFENLVKDPVELEKISKSLRRSMESVKQIETLGDLQDSFKETREYHVSLAELEAKIPPEEREEEEFIELPEVGGIDLKNPFTYKSKQLQKAVGVTSFEGIEHSINKLNGYLLLIPEMALARIGYNKHYGSVDEYLRGKKRDITCADG